MSPLLDDLTKISVAFGLAVTLGLIYLNELQVIEKPAVAQISQKLDTPWRYTSTGWQDSTQWQPRPVFPKPTAANVHPFVWTALITLAALFVLVWSSKEELTIGKQAKVPRTPLRGQCECIPRCKNFCLQELLPRNYTK